MSVFSIPIAVGNLAGTQFAPMEAMVDTGASHSVIPRDTLEAMGIQPRKLVEFEIVGGDLVQYQVGYARIRLAGAEVTTMVIFGPAGTSALVGATTLEQGRFAVDPVRERLVPASADY